jgi:hypothetical protein
MTERPHRVPHWLFALFMRIKEPRSTRLAFFCIYLILFLGGISSFYGPPLTIEAVLGAGLTAAWGILFTLGGALGASSVLRGSWWMERAGLIFCATAYGMYGVVITGLQLSESRPYSMQLCIIAVALITLVLRWSQIRRYQFDPEG